MIILSTNAGDVMLNALGRSLDSGSIELLSGAGSPVASPLKLSSPAAKPAEGGELELNTIAEGTAIATGKVSTARILASDGSELFVCDVGDMRSEATIKLSTTTLQAGGPVRLTDFRLVMP
jgi:hypothetical protein